MSQGGKFAERFADYGVPERRDILLPTGTHRIDILLPGGISVAESINTDGRLVWRITDQTQFQSEIDVQDVLVATTFTEEEEQVLAQLSLAGAFHRRVLRYAGFIIDHLYLHSNNVLCYEHGAILSRLFLSFWQQREQTGDNNALFALPMLWRSYWRALTLMIDCASEDEYARILTRWREIDLYHEYERALSAWQQVCLSDDDAWFFADVLWSWQQRGCATWQLLREEEVHALIQPYTQPTTSRLLRSTRVRRQLESLVQIWYRPRYDLWTAGKIQCVLARSNGGRPSVVLAWVKQPLSLARLYAAIGAGYMATALQGDTWSILYDVTRDQRCGLMPFWMWVMVTLALTTLGYLTNGIARRTGVGVWHAFQRAFGIWVSGEICAILIGALLSWLLAPMIKPEAHMSLLAWLSLILVYAQIALFFGIFIQLLFDDKPTTAPIDAP